METEPKKIQTNSANSLKIATPVYNPVEEYNLNLCGSTSSSLCPSSGAFCSRDLFYNGTAKGEFQTLFDQTTSPTFKKLARGFSIELADSKSDDSKNVLVEFVCGHRPINATFPPQVVFEDDSRIQIEWRSAVACQVVDSFLIENTLNRVILRRFLNNLVGR